MSTHRSSAASTGAMQCQRRLRVLALHSFRTSGAIFKEQLTRGNWLQRMGDMLDVVFVDAPHPASGAIPRDVKPFFVGPYYEWFTAEMQGDKVVYDVQKVDRSLEYVAQILRDQGPFDGIMGFSQGTAMASTIVAFQQAGWLLQDIPPLQFCVLFAGFRPRYAPHAQAWEAKLAIPSLHVYGDRDEIRVSSRDLSDAFNSPVVLQHPRGHSIPNLHPVQLAVAKAFFTTVLSSIQDQQSRTSPSQAQLQGRPAGAGLTASNNNNNNNNNNNSSSKPLINIPITAHLQGISLAADTDINGKPMTLQKQRPADVGRDSQPDSPSARL